MKTQPSRPHAARGFTLTELMVVVLIIVILVSILMPSLMGARVQMYRTSCLNNIKRIGEGCMGYIQDGTLNRGTTGLALPSAGPTTTDWGAKNPLALVLLLKRDFIAVETLLCPEAGLRVDHTRMTTIELQTNPPTVTDTNCSYSYLSQVPFTFGSNTFTATTSMEANGYLVLVADRNPRCKIGATQLFAQGDFDHNGSVSTTESQKVTELGTTRVQNSLNHDWDGQNVGRLDLSAMWYDNPNVPTNSPATVDSIYQSRGGDGPTGQGLRQPGSMMDDDFLVLP